LRCSCGSMDELQAKLRRWSCKPEWENTPTLSRADASPVVSTQEEPVGLVFETVPEQSSADALATSKNGVGADGSGAGSIKKSADASEFDFHQMLRQARKSAGIEELERSVDHVQASMKAKIRRRFQELVKLGMAPNDAAARAIVEASGRVTTTASRGPSCGSQAVEERPGTPESESSSSDAIEVR